MFLRKFLIIILSFLFIIPASLASDNSNILRYSITSDISNVMSGPGQNYNIIKKLNKGDVVKGSIFNDNWIKIEDDMQNNFISRNHVEEYSFNLFSHASITFIMLIIISFLIAKFSDPFYVPFFIFVAFLGSAFFFLDNDPFVAYGMIGVACLSTCLSIIYLVASEPILAILLGGGLIAVGWYFKIDSFIYWLCAIVCNILLVLANGYQHRCKNCRKWWAVYEYNRDCIDTEECSIRDTCETVDKNGNVIYTQEVEVPGTAYTYKVNCVCRFCGKHTYHHEYKEFRN